MWSRLPVKSQLFDTARVIQPVLLQVNRNRACHSAAPPIDVRCSVGALGVKQRRPGTLLVT